MSCHCGTAYIPSSPVDDDVNYPSTTYAVLNMRPVWSVTGGNIDGPIAGLQTSYEFQFLGWWTDIGFWFDRGASTTINFDPKTGRWTGGNVDLGVPCITKYNSEFGGTWDRIGGTPALHPHVAQSFGDFREPTILSGLWNGFLEGPGGEKMRIGYWSDNSGIYYNETKQRTEQLYRGSYIENLSDPWDDSPSPADLYELGPFVPSGDVFSTGWPPGRGSGSPNSYYFYYYYRDTANAKTWFYKPNLNFMGGYGWLLTSGVLKGIYNDRFGADFAPSDWYDAALSNSEYHSAARRALVGSWTAPASITIEGDVKLIWKSTHYGIHDAIYHFTFDSLEHVDKDASVQIGYRFIRPATEHPVPNQFPRVGKFLATVTDPQDANRSVDLYWDGFFNWRIFPEFGFHVIQNENYWPMGAVGISGYVYDQNNILQWTVFGNSVLYVKSTAALADGYNFSSSLPIKTDFLNEYRDATLS